MAVIEDPADVFHAGFTRGWVWGLISGAVFGGFCAFLLAKL